MSEVTAVSLVKATTETDRRSPGGQEARAFLALDGETYDAPTAHAAACLAYGEGLDPEVIALFRSKHDRGHFEAYHYTDEATTFLGDLWEQREPA